MKSIVYCLRCCFVKDRINSWYFSLQARSIPASFSDGSMLHNSRCESFRPSYNPLFRYERFQFAAVVALTWSLQLRPECSQLGKYAMPREQRMQLFFGVETLAPKKDVGLKVVSFIKYCQTSPGKGAQETEVQVLLLPHILTDNKGSAKVIR